MVTIKSAAELAVTVRKVAGRLPSHYFRETRDLYEAANVLDSLDVVQKEREPAPTKVTP